MAMFLNSGVFFGLARHAYARIAEAPSDRDRRDNALTAILFSVIAIEAFINESAELAKHCDTKDPPTVVDSLRSFATLCSEDDGQRGSITQKFQLASVVFTGRTYDKGSQPYQDFDILIKLRNELVHPKVHDKVKGSLATPYVEPPRVVKDLRSRNVLPPTGNRVQSWIGLIARREVAQWACNTAVSMVHSLTEMIPDSVFKQTVRFQAQTFVPV